MSDQVKITETLAKLDKEITGGEPYVLGVPGNKRLTFEDFTSWSGERAQVAEDLINIATGVTDAPMDEFARKWLTAKDFETWKGLGLSFRQKATILKQASEHVLKDMSPGESAASSS
ncbi:hypothetical protein [Flaviflexus massiliensis]|uniref:hypothetical protein n=1 Tax=Flaviflexus massiliensis TaxID=1522309 RepID=UPI0006D597F2|nr:hypothetical protein [Flaviflexus massiliensis]